MYVYRITNLINGKAYIGITNDYHRRWNEHRSYHNPNRVISRAIAKYGKDNFKFELLYSDLSIEESETKEIELIQKYNTLAPKGYNISKGGNLMIGCNNGRSLLSQEEVEYIKSNRNQPMYKLYEGFADIISYQAFKKIYNDQTYRDIRPTVEPYPYNMEYSLQFNSGLLTESEVEDLRRQYLEGVHWKEAYKKFSDRIAEGRFWQIYSGRGYRLVMPEVFTDENRKKHASKGRGSSNGRSKLREEQVLEIRARALAGEAVKDIAKDFPVSNTTIRDIVSRKTWSHLS